MSVEDMDIELLKRRFSIEMVGTKDISDRCCLCNPQFVEDILESAALDAVEYDDYYAMFLKHNDQPVAECVFHILSPTYAKIELLCSKQNKLGAATMLMCSLLDKLKNYGIKTIQLNIAKYDINAHATSFYQKFGFQKSHENVYSLNLTTYSGECKFFKTTKRGRGSSSASSTKPKKQRDSSNSSDVKYVKTVRPAI